MQRSATALVLAAFATFGFAKPPLGVTTTWDLVMSPQISPDGRFVSYSIGPNLFLASTDHTIHREFDGAEAFQFTSDGRYFLVTLPGGNLDLISLEHGAEEKLSGLANSKLAEDGGRSILVTLSANERVLAIRDLNTGVESKIDEVGSFQLSSSGRWLAYRSSSSQKQLRVRDLESNSDETCGVNVEQYCFAPTGSALLFQSDSQSGGTTKFALEWCDLDRHQIHEAGKLPSLATSFKFDRTGGAVAFLLSRTVGKAKVAEYPSQYPSYEPEDLMPMECIKPQIVEEDVVKRTLMFYRPGAAEAEALISDDSPQIGADKQIDGIFFGFSMDGSQVLFMLKKRPKALTTIPKPDDQVDVELWSYKDRYLPSEIQYGHSDTREELLCGVSLETKRCLQFGNQYPGIPASNYIIERSYSKPPKNPLERLWGVDERSAYLVSLRDGQKKLLSSGSYIDAEISPDDKCVVYFDHLSGDYDSYDIATGRRVNLTAGLGAPFSERSTSRLRPYSRLGEIHWIDQGSALMLHDQYDAWRFDPEGKRPPLCLTNGYGRKHKIEFHTIENLPDGLLLLGYDTVTGDTGYYSASRNAPVDPKPLTMGPYIYSGFSDPHGLLPINIFGNPRKASNADIYVLQRMSATEPANVFVTSDFAHYTQVSDYHPQRAYNWLTSQMIDYKTLDGVPSRGILYKPEDFDPKKKYPVVFWFYQENARALNTFLEPGPSSYDLNIPYYVSNGYLVFVPDITDFKIGDPATSVYNAVEAAAQTVAKLPFVDAARMGMQGHSYGGYEVNVMVTRSKRFAAAIESCGITDLITQSGSLEGQVGISLLGSVEDGQGRLGGSLSEYRDRYIRNSPVFFADKVSTPLLMIHNKRDAAITWTMATQWFSYLIRNNKKAWMLEYDDEAHVIGKERNQIDYTIRMQQFFDHYLKGMPEPRWMAEGLDVHLKGIDQGLNLVKP